MCAFVHLFHYTWLFYKFLIDTSLRFLLAHSSFENLSIAHSSEILPIDYICYTFILYTALRSFSLHSALRSYYTEPLDISVAYSLGAGKVGSLLYIAQGFFFFITQSSRVFLLHNGRGFPFAHNSGVSYYTQLRSFILHTALGFPIAHGSEISYCT